MKKQNKFKNSLKVQISSKETRETYPEAGKDAAKLRAFYESDEVTRKIQEMAMKISEDYMGKPLALVCVEYGGRPLYNLLVDNLHSLGITNFYQGSVKVEIDATKKSEDRIEPKFHFESGIVSDLNKLDNMNLVIVDDQINSGRTFDFLRERYKNASSVELATLIVKGKAKKRMDDIKYYGFYTKSSTDKYVGFGMDYKEQHRELPYIARIKQKGQYSRNNNALQNNDLTNNPSANNDSKENSSKDHDSR